MKNIKSSFDEVRGFVGMRVIEGGKPPPPVVVNVKVADDGSVRVPDRVNKSPGASAIGKIGTKTKDEIIAVLKAGRQPNHDKYGDHLKLLWQRGEIKYDGKEYYI